MEFFTFNWINDPQIWLSLITLSALEIVLGIDNLVFIAILTRRLPAQQRAASAREVRDLVEDLRCGKSCRLIVIGPRLVQDVTRQQVGNDDIFQWSRIT